MLLMQETWKTKEFVDSWVGKIPWRREWQSTPVFLPGESHGQKSSWCCKESDTTEQLSNMIYLGVLHVHLRGGVLGRCVSGLVSLWCCSGFCTLADIV